MALRRPFVLFALAPAAAMLFACSSSFVTGDGSGSSDASTTPDATMTPPLDSGVTPGDSGTTTSDSGFTNGDDTEPDAAPDSSAIDGSNVTVDASAPDAGGCMPPCANGFWCNTASTCQALTPLAGACAHDYECQEPYECRSNPANGQLVCAVGCDPNDHTSCTSSGVNNPNPTCATPEDTCACPAGGGQFEVCSANQVCKPDAGCQ